MSASPAFTHTTLFDDSPFSLGKARPCVLPFGKNARFCLFSYGENSLLFRFFVISISPQNDRMRIHLRLFPSTKRAGRLGSASADTSLSKFCSLWGYAGCAETIRCSVFIIAKNGGLVKKKFSTGAAYSPRFFERNAKKGLSGDSPYTESGKCVTPFGR